MPYASSSSGRPAEGRAHSCAHTCALDLPRAEPMISLAPKPPAELALAAEDAPSLVCERVAGYAQRQAWARGRARFFAAVAVALGRAQAREGGLEAGGALARELANHIQEPWARDGIDRGLALYSTCVDETGRRCAAALVADYFGWREPPDRFFHRVCTLVATRDAAELVRLARLTASYARMPKPAAGELRMVAAVPTRDARAGQRRRLAVLAFAGEPLAERLRTTTELPSLGSDGLLQGLSSVGLGQLAEPEPPEVPLVGRPLLWFPRDADHELRRLHLLLASAIA